MRTVAERAPLEQAYAPARATPGIKLATSPLYGHVDWMGTHSFAPDGTPDFVFDVDLDTRVAIKNLFVVVRGRGQQWDTVVGNDPTPGFGEIQGQSGQATWHVGVRDHNRWLNGHDGSLPLLPAGSYSLELVADVSGPYSVFEVIVELDNGTTLTATVQGSVVCNAIPSGNGSC